MVDSRLSITAGPSTKAPSAMRARSCTWAAIVPVLRNQTSRGGLADGVRAAHCEYGVRFPALVVRDRLYGTQFHPEKSQGWGLRLLANFARLAAEPEAARA